MGTGRRHGRPDDSAAGAAADVARALAGAAAPLAEAARGGDRAAFTAALGAWSEALFARAGWALWVWSGSAFELAATGGEPPPPAVALEGTGRALATEATRTKLATGRASLLMVAATGPDVAGGAVAFGDPAAVLAVLAVYRSGSSAVVGAADLAALTETGRLCSAVLAGVRAAPVQAPVQAQAPAQVPGPGPPGVGPSRLLAGMRAPLEAIAATARSLIDAEASFGRVDRRRHHEVIEAHGLALAATVDEAAIVAARTPGAPEARPVPMDLDVFAAEVDRRLARGLDVTVGPDLGTALPAFGDARDLAVAVAGLARAVMAAGGGTVEVAAAVGDGIGRIGVTAAIEQQHGSGLAATVRAVEAGGEPDAWSGSIPLALAAAAVVARTHGGRLGADASGGQVSIWLDLPRPPFDPTSQGQ